MKVTIIRGDNAVYVDGYSILGIDCSELPPEVHAVQWYHDHGDVEIVNEKGHHIENRHITDLSPYQKFVDAHSDKKAAIELAEAQAREEMVALNGKVTVLE